MNKTLLKSVREYKKQSILAPILVILEVLMEVLIPMEMANIIDIGMTSGDLHYIIQRGVILVAMAMLSLFFGISAGNMAAVAGAGTAFAAGVVLNGDADDDGHEDAGDLVGHPLDGCAGALRF